jgi:hypothetical protein
MAENSNGLCVLITNAFIENWSGSELYVRDLAVELVKRGHKPVVYSPRIGKLAEEFARKSIPVIKDLGALEIVPDLIHGQHHLETMTALARFPRTPAVFFCHGWLPWEESPPFHPRLLHYVTVSEALRDRLVYECGVPAEKITTILNSVDLDRFRPRSPLPEVPKRALVFNSQASAANILEPVRQACAQQGVQVDVMGYGSGNPSYHPEDQLGSYDLIFGVGRAALESLAVGAAVICCSQEGVGPMVSTQNLDWLRRNNFGIRILTRPLGAAVLSSEIRCYDPVDALKVSQAVRAAAGLNEMVERILAVYTSAMNSYAENPGCDQAAESLAYAVYLKGISDRVTRTGVEISSADERARLVQGELDDIKSRFFWRIYLRLSQSSLLRNLYARLFKPIFTKVRR